MGNPFDLINKKLELVDLKLDKLLNPPAENYNHKYYTVREAAKILKCTPQTVKNRIKRNEIKVKPNVIPYRIPHYQIFDSEDHPIRMKYRR